MATIGCPCCYDGAARASTGYVLGIPCTACGGTGERRIEDIVEVTINVGAPRERCGYDPAADGAEVEVYDAVMREINGAHIGVNPDGAITPFRGRGGRPN